MGVVVIYPNLPIMQPLVRALVPYGWSDVKNRHQEQSAFDLEGQILDIALTKSRPRPI